MTLKQIQGDADIGGGTLFRNVAGTTNFQGLGALNTLAATTTVTPVTNPTENILLVPIWGQSNAVGFGQTAASIPSYLSGVLARGRIYNYETSTTGNLQIGYNNNFGVQKIYPYFGPEMNLAYQLGEFYSAPVCIVKYAIDGTSMQTFWKPSLATGYTTLTNTIDAAVSFLQGLGYTVHMPCICSMQGESDAINDALSANNYYTNRTDMNTALKSKYGAGLIEIYGRINSQLPTDPTRVSTVRTAQATFQSDDPTKRIMIDTDAYPLQADLTHFTGAGQVTQGLDWFNQVKLLYP